MKNALTACSPSPPSGERAGVRGLVNTLVLLCLQATLCHSAPQLAWETRHNFGLPARTKAARNNNLSK